MSDASYNANVYTKQGSTELVVDSSGLITVEGTLSISTGGTQTINGTQTISTGATQTVNGTLAMGSSATFQHAAIVETTGVNINNSGYSFVGSTTGTTVQLYTLDAPATGGVKYIYCSNASATGFVNVETGSTAITFGETTDAHFLRFNAAEEAVTLVAASTLKWTLVGNVGAVAVTTSVT